MKEVLIIVSVVFGLASIMIHLWTETMKEAEERVMELEKENADLEQRLQETKLDAVSPSRLRER